MFVVGVGWRRARARIRGMLGRGMAVADGDGGGRGSSGGSETCICSCVSGDWGGGALESPYLLEGSCVFLLFARPTGSYEDGSATCAPLVREASSSRSVPEFEAEVVDRNRFDLEHCEHIEGCLRKM